MLWKIIKYITITSLVLFLAFMTLGAVLYMNMTPEERELARQKAEKERQIAEKEKKIAEQKARKEKEARDKHQAKLDVDEKKHELQQTLEWRGRRTCKDILRKAVKYPETLVIHWDSDIRRRKNERQIRYAFTAKNAFGVPLRQNIYCNFTKDYSRIKKYFIQ